jgi:hypothetical protein
MFGKGGVRHRYADAGRGALVRVTDVVVAGIGARC